MNVGVVIVWYNPTKSQIENVYSLANTRELKICIVDNSNDENLFEKKTLSSKNISYIHNSNKGGIAGAFNRGINKLFAERTMKHIFTMDQDSELSEDYFLSMWKFVRDNNCEIACPNFYDRNSKTYGTFINLTPFFYKAVNNGTTTFCISSGMIFSRKAWEILGDFDERLIIDHVDTDYCLKANNHKVTILVNYEQCLNHAIGERESHRILGVTLKPNHHNYIRKYYIVRNGTYLALKYFKFSKGYFNLNILRVIHETVCVILYENDKIRKLSYMLRGLRDGIKGKLGAIK